MTTFANDEGFDELVIAHDIPIRSPVAYLPHERIVGLSTRARVTEMFSPGLEVHERFTTQIGHWINEQLQPKGVGVVMEANTSA
jgi:GTP cyclohydrolase I